MPPRTDDAASAEDAEQTGPLDHGETGSSSRFVNLLVLAAVMAVAANLRTAVTVVGPLVPTIRESLGVSNVQIGLIGTIPVLAFGALSPFAAGLGRRVGIAVSLAGSMGLLSLALLVRSAGGYGMLVVGTTLIGVAIAISNVLLPALVKDRFPTRAASLTSAYGAALVIGASISAAVAVPLAQVTSWQFSLGIWALPAAGAAAIVLFSNRVERRDAARAHGPVPVSPAGGVSAGVMHRSPLAWQVTAFTGLQSLFFYVILAWLPDILIADGMTDVQAGVMVSVLNIGGLVGIIVFPLLAGRVRDQRWVGLADGALMVAGTLMFIALPVGVAPVASVITGIGSGGSLGLCLLFYGLRTTDSRDAAALSGMAQTYGYGVSAIGPVAWGALNELTGGWDVPLLALLAIAVASAVMAFLSGRDRTLDTA